MYIVYIGFELIMIVQVRVFFMRLDEELNKVNQFYRKQESEFLERGETLNKQLQILLELKQIINDHRRKTSKPYNTGISSPQYSPTRDSDYSGQLSLSSHHFSFPNSKQIEQNTRKISY